MSENYKITMDNNIKPQDFADMYTKVKKFENKQSERIDDTWNKISSDKIITSCDVKKLEKATGKAIESFEIEHIEDLVKQNKNINITPEALSELDKLAKKQKKQESQLDKGIILKETFPLGDNFVEEKTQGIVNVSFEYFIKKIPPKEWGIKLADYLGGERKTLGDDKQLERMVLSTIGKDLDMTKIEGVNFKKDENGKIKGVKITWEVKKSDNDSVNTDIGSLTFESYKDNKTRVIFHSAHKLNVFPFNIELKFPPSAFIT